MPLILNYTNILQMFKKYKCQHMFKYISMVPNKLKKYTLYMIVWMFQKNVLFERTF